MSMAPCFADTNDLALDPATTAEDTQQILGSISSHTGVLLWLSVSPSAPLPCSVSVCRSYLTLTLHLCHLRFLPLPHSAVKYLCASLTTNTFHRSLSNSHHFSPSLSYSLSSSPSISISLSVVCLSVSFCISVSPSLFLGAAISFIVPRSWWTMSAHMGAPVRSQPRRQGGPENTHNSVL